MEREDFSHAAGLQLLRPEFRDIAMAAPAPISALPTAILRIVLGLAWTANAALKWFPAFGASFLPMLTGASQDQPGFLKPWFNLVTAGQPLPPRPRLPPPSPPPRRYPAPPR